GGPVERRPAGRLGQGLALTLLGEAEQRDPGEAGRGHVGWRAGLGSPAAVLALGLEEPAEWPIQVRFGPGGLLPWRGGLAPGGGTGRRDDDERGEKQRGDVRHGRKLRKGVAGGGERRGGVGGAGGGGAGGAWPGA